MYRVVKNSFRKASILQVNFTTEDEIYNPESSFVLRILRNKDMVKIKAVAMILKLLADFKIEFQNIIW